MSQGANANRSCCRLVITLLLLPCITSGLTSKYFLLFLTLNSVMTLIFDLAVLQGVRKRLYAFFLTSPPPQKKNIFGPMIEENHFGGKGTPCYHHPPFPQVYVCCLLWLFMVYHVISSTQVSVKPHFFSCNEFTSVSTLGFVLFPLVIAKSTFFRIFDDYLAHVMK